MRELDVLLMGYVDREYMGAQPAHQAAFEKLLTLQDPEILALLLNRVEIDDSSLRYVVQRLLDHP